MTAEKYISFWKENKISTEEKEYIKEKIMQLFFNNNSKNIRDFAPNIICSILKFSSGWPNLIKNLCTIIKNNNIDQKILSIKTLTKILEINSKIVFPNHDFFEILSLIELLPKIKNNETILLTILSFPVI